MLTKINLNQVDLTLHILSTLEKFIGTIDEKDNGKKSNLAIILLEYLELWCSECVKGKSNEKKQYTLLYGFGRCLLINFYSFSANV